MKKQKYHNVRRLNLTSYQRFMKEQPALDLTGRRRTSGVVVTVEDLKELLTGEQAIITVSCLMKARKRREMAQIRVAHLDT